MGENYGEEIVYSDRHFDNLIYEDHHFRNLYFTNCSFHHCVFKNCTIEDSNFDNCELHDCDISMLKFKQTPFRKLFIRKSQARAIMWVDAIRPFSIEFLDSCISYSSFYGKDLKGARFINCIAEEVDFSECNLSSTIFHGTDLKGAIFYNTDLRQSSFVGAKNYRIDPASNRLKKAKFCLPEAISFLEILNIELVDTKQN